MRQVNECDAASRKQKDAEKIIRAMRLYLGYSQEKVARRVGISSKVYSRYDTEAGYAQKGKLSEVCAILKFLHLNPRKFYQGQYVLNEAGYKAASQRTGPLNHMLRISLQKCCPVSCKKAD